MSQNPSRRSSSYGTWESPIKSRLIAENTIAFSEISFDLANSKNNDVYWLELRPSESGRYAIVRYSRSNGTIEDVIPKSFNSRTKVHEYGGGSYIVHNESIYFSNFADQRLYHLKETNLPTPLTLDTEKLMRYADFIVDQKRQRLYCVREDHTNAKDSSQVVNTLVSIGLNDGKEDVLVDGYDFYSSPRLSNDGKYLVWSCWNHPNMPWDNTELWLAKLDDNGKVLDKQKLVGNSNESVCQPEWSPDNKYLYFISDRNGWWNLYRLNIDQSSNIEEVYTMEAEFGGPQWQFRSTFYGFSSNENIVATYANNGGSFLSTIDVQTKKMSTYSLDSYTDIKSVSIRNNNNMVYFVGASATKPSEIVEFDLTSLKINVLRQSSNITIDKAYLSIPKAISFPTTIPNNTQKEIAYGFYYPPKNDDYQTNDKNELPLLLVRSHGGPTASTTSAFNLKIQYWTSRGFAVLDVNYRGSTGFGREYREKLKNNWGIYDVLDCINGAKYLVEQNLVDKNRLVIDGGSAGGYTTLCALTFYDTFSSGASHYGVSDLELLAKDTHKFESRYLDSIIGPYPECKDLYIQRSPINHVQQLSKPIIFFQGLEDKIVLPSQAQLMVDALKQKHLPVAYVTFEGEQHGFRKSENIERSLDGEFYFYSKIFKFKMADCIEPIPIENLPSDDK
ncbi:unnamed protein product [Didymodactylos carnosus]|uniref:Peptidase S9 prolyl oligopeptidase catalytic domain-containing protein n=1 Tax=Didymodactylos carnosus TaxID=1234261 RepID=A0A815CL00_9BILA|nr:unnamed protein product [Didymodactylos carnosus]CAF1288983.1 unnamed protein product [Didymodactylos carnosus]CAF3508339.1 unnamed protein product [Didymodactylos carnosus]CAF4093207.1 unnamed protein product [Didymodactylos carnosus]